jgi:hypothetical protein
MDGAFPWDPLEYPFAVPSDSFLWMASRAEPLSSSEFVHELITQRHAVLAIGSNASPAQLTRKFSDERFVDPASPNGRIPVLRAVAEGVDVVYGAHLAEYGSLPATLLDTPGTRAHVFVTWLTSMQLERMNETEGLGHSYQLRQIGGVRSHGEVVDAAMSYVTVGGVAVLGGGPLGLVSINASGSSWPRGTQRQAWDSLAVDMGCGTDGKTLLDRVLGSHIWRKRVESHLDSNRLAEIHSSEVAET